MFERAGFRVVARRQSNPTTPVRPIVRLELRASSSRANSPGPGVDIVMRWRRSVPAEFRRYITEQRRRQHPELAICWYALLRVRIRSCGERRAVLDAHGLPGGRSLERTLRICYPR